MARYFFEGLDHAKLYSDFRHAPPMEVISSILNYMGTKLPRRHAIDVGCGSGQGTTSLSPHFQKVTGFDISEAQIAEAIANRKQDNIEYKVAPAEELPVDSEAVELITAFASFHWFDIPKFLAEVKRILVPNGVLAISAYFPTMKVLTENPEKNQMLHDLFTEVYFGTFKLYSIPQMGSFLNELRDINFPFQDVQRESKISKKFSSTAEYAVGNIKSSSCFQQLKKVDPEKARNLVVSVEQRMKDILGVQEPLENIPLNYEVEFYLVLCRKERD